MADQNFFDPTKIEAQLKRVLTSRRFTTASNLAKFLRYVVDMKLANREAEIKAYTIAVDALGRPESFDSQNDPTVRVLAGRLRNALRDYYDDEGANDSITIQLPKGHYVPEFVTNESAVSAEVKNEDNFVVPKPASSRKKWLIISAALSLAFVLLGYFANVVWPSLERSAQTSQVAAQSIAILVKENTTDAERANIDASAQFVERLRAALVRNEALSIATSKTKNVPNSKEASKPANVDFVIDVIARKNETSQRISLELINARTNVLLWSRTKEISVGDDFEESYDKTVVLFVKELELKIFGASVAALEGRDPNSLTASQLFVLATWIPGPAKNSLSWEKQRVELARLALKKAPEFGPAHSVLADKLAYLAAVDGPSNTEKAMMEAKASAIRALELAPGDANTVFNVAQSHWHSGRVEESVRTMKRVLELDPNHTLARFFSIVYPFTCIVAPDEILNSALAFDQSLESDNPVRWITLTWIGWLHLNRDELNRALDNEQRAALIFQIPYTSMRHAAVLNQLGRSDEAAQTIQTQRSNWPNIDPMHFSKNTIPRLCSEAPNPQIMLKFYENLARNVKVDAPQ